MKLDTVLHHSFEIGKALQQLAEWYETRSEADILSILRSLAKAGARLRRALFTDPDRENASTEIRRWFAEAYDSGGPQGNGDRELRILAPATSIFLGG